MKYLVKLEFDDRLFNPEKLTREYMESVLRRRIGGRGVDIRVIKPLRIYTFDAEEYDEESFKCGGCLWSTRTLYIIAENREEAERLLKEGLAGLCGECLVEKVLVEGGYVISKD